MSGDFYSKTASRRGIQARHGAHAGLVDRILNALATGPMTARELAEELGVPLSKVSSAVKQKMDVTGGITYVKDSQPRQYMIPKPAAEVRVPEFKPLRRDFFAHAHLAMMTRR